jgi:RNA polymerase sigma-70 factor (ECF subfamily)
MRGVSDHDSTDLLDRIRSGDQTARDELLDRFRPQLRRMVAARMDDRMATRVDPSDVVQEALVVAHRRLPEYLKQDDSPFYPWLRQIAWDRLIEAHREHIRAGKRSVRREVSMQLSEASSQCLAKQMAASGTSPSRHFARKELQGQIRAILGELADLDREILILKHLEELSNSECATVLGITIVAVKKRYLRALTRVRSLMDGENWRPM